MEIEELYMKITTKMYISWGAYGFQKHAKIIDCSSKFFLLLLGRFEISVKNIQRMPYSVGNIWPILDVISVVGHIYIFFFGTLQIFPIFVLH